MQGSGNQKNVIQGDLAQNIERRGIERRQRDTFAGALLVTGQKAESVHRLHRFCLPVRDDVAGVFVEAEVTADIQIKVEPIAFIAKKRIAAGNSLAVHEGCKPLEFPFLRGQTPCLEIEVKCVVIHDVLLQPLDTPVGRQLGEVGKPRIFPPLPDARRHQIGQHQRKKQVGKNKNFHIGQGGRRGVFFEAVDGDWRERSCAHSSRICNEKEESATQYPVLRG